MKVKFCLRANVGKAEETAEPPADVHGRDLIGWLDGREVYATPSKSRR
jgi:hypothetical protein